MSEIYMSIALAVVLGLFLAILLLIEIGYRLGTFRNTNESEGPGVTAIDGAVFALMGLLIAFTFSGAASRFDSRRELIVQEANNIGTAWLRLDVLSPEDQIALREDFRSYIDARMEIYKKLPDIAAARKELARANAIQQQIWAKAVPATRSAPPNSGAAMLLLPALNEMFDIATLRTAAAELHPPIAIFLMLSALLLISSFLSGYGMAGSKSRNWIHTLSYAFIMASAIYVILDLEFPRLGLIRIEVADHFMAEVREAMR